MTDTRFTVATDTLRAIAPAPDRIALARGERRLREAIVAQRTRRRFWQLGFTGVGSALLAAALVLVIVRPKLPFGDLTAMVPRPAAPAPGAGPGATIGAPIVDDAPPTGPQVAELPLLAIEIPEGDPTLLVVDPTPPSPAPRRGQVVGKRVTQVAPGEGTSGAVPLGGSEHTLAGRDAALQLYQSAHDAHFGKRNYASALRGWDAYLAAAPSGALAPEARYNRAICLVKLGRLAEAERALARFADGRESGYKQAEAARLLERIAATRGGR